MKRFAVLAAAIFAMVALVFELQGQDPAKEKKDGLFDKKEAPKIEFPNVEDIIKGLPEGTDPKVIDKLKKDLAGLKKKFEDMQKNAGGPGGFPFPGGGDKGFPFPGGDKGFPFPGGDKGFPFPGGFGGAFGKTGPGRLGIEASPITDVLVEQLDLPPKKGLVIEKVEADSAAAKAGFKKSDILLEFNGKEVSAKPEELKKIVGEIKTGEPVEAQVLRKGKKEMIKDIKLPEPKKQDDKGFPFPKDKGFPFPGGDKGGDKGFPLPGGDKGLPGGGGGLIPGPGSRAVPILHDERLRF